jgi:hypothetical protein
MEHRFFFSSSPLVRDGAPERGTGVGLDRERDGASGSWASSPASKWAGSDVFSSVSLTEALSLSKKEGLRERAPLERERKREVGEEKMRVFVILGERVYNQVLCILF